MRLALASVRQADNDVVNRSGAMPERLTWRATDALRWATRNGADALGLERRIGSLTPGKDADLIVVGGPSVGAWPVVDPVGSLVFQATTATVRHVLIGGRWAKRDGVLTGVALARLRHDVEESARSILERIRSRVPFLPPPPMVAPEAIEAFAAMNFAER
jgi:cytosine/adenosine deaminase-related metal-dependent hydrolase